MRSACNGKESFARDLGDALEVARLRSFGGPGREVFALDRRRERRRISEEAAGLARLETREACGLEIGGSAVGGLDHRLEFRRRTRRQAEAQVDGSEQPAL